MSEDRLESMTMNSRIRLRELTQRVEKGVVIVGQGDQFLELPPAGLEFIAWLNEGLSLGEARERFEAVYNPFPEEGVMGVVNAFLDCDFVAAIDGQDIPRWRAIHRPETTCSKLK